MALRDTGIDEYGRLVADLVCTSEAALPPRPALPPGKREAVERVVAQLLIRADLFKNYQQIIGPEMRLHPELMAAVRAGRDDFPVDEVVSRGLGCLGDEQLARLALDEAELTNLGDYLAELFESAGCGEVWDDLALSDTLEPTPYDGPRGERPRGASPPLALTAHAKRCETGGPTPSWMLCGGPSGLSLVRLPSEVSRECYGTADQEVFLWLHRNSAGPGRWAVRLNMTPPPSLAGLAATVSFRDGCEVTFTVPTLDAGTEMEWSSPLPDAAFGDDAWQLSVRFRPLPDSGGPE